MNNDSLPDKKQRQELVERVAMALCRHSYPARTIEEYVSPSVQLWERLIPEAEVAVEAMLSAPSHVVTSATDPSIVNIGGVKHVQCDCADNEECKLGRKRTGPCQPSRCCRPLSSVFAATPSATATSLPATGELIEAFTPTTYPGQHKNFPPPFINISEARTPYEEAVITVRGQHKEDGSAGDVSAMVLRKFDLMCVLLRTARRCGWLPMTDEQWQRDFYASNPDEAKKARERIAELTRKREEAARVLEETTAALADIPTPP